MALQYKYWLSSSLFEIISGDSLGLWAFLVQNGEITELWVKVILSRLAFPHFYNEGSNQMFSSSLLHPNMIFSSSLDTEIQRLISLGLREVARVGNDMLYNNRTCVCWEL